MFNIILIQWLYKQALSFNNKQKVSIYQTSNKLYSVIVQQQFEMKHPLVYFLQKEQFILRMRINGRDGLDGNYLIFKQPQNWQIFFNTLQNAFQIQRPIKQYLIRIPGNLFYNNKPSQLLCRDQLNALSKVLPCKGQSLHQSLLSQGIGSKIHIQLNFQKSIVNLTMKLQIPQTKLKRVIFRQCKQYTTQQLKVFQKQKITNIQVFGTFSLPFQIFQKTLISKDQQNQYNERIILQKDMFHGLLIHRLYAKQGYIWFCQRFPQGFQVFIQHIQINASLDYTLIQKYNQKLLIFQGTINKSQILQVKIPFQKLLLAFEHYKLIGIGGQQFGSVPVISQKGYYQWPQVLIGKNPQPDFSMPFKVIAMTLGLIVYNWINLWRTVFILQR